MSARIVMESSTTKTLAGDMLTLSFFRRRSRLTNRQTSARQRYCLRDARAHHDDSVWG
ncbi:MULTISPECIES: hypothetical protein [unclassified Aurantimonas]|uniref:hypothetical protein n=1 Tax=unclassified Aurantimonas TaxID=2638230 RepID=UPI002E193CBC|nr:hypothetical protein [Aurantimonas sp. C2-4-R8]